MKRLVFVLLCALGVVSPGAAASVDCAAVGELPAFLTEKPTTPLCSGDSAPVRVDTRTGVRTAAASETLTYSADRSGHSDRVVITDNGDTVLNTSGSGAFEWRPVLNGKHTLKHTTWTNGVPVVLTAQYTVALPVKKISAKPIEVTNTTYKVVTSLGDLASGVSDDGPRLRLSTSSVSDEDWQVYSHEPAWVVYTCNEGYVFGDGSTNRAVRLDTASEPASNLFGETPALRQAIASVKALQRYPWNGLVDIEYTIPSGMVGDTLTVAACDGVTGETCVATNVTFEAQKCAVGTHRLTWDMDADGVRWVSTNVVFKVMLGKDEQE